MKKILKRFKFLNIYLQIIVIFCLWGFLKNAYLFITSGSEVEYGFRIYGGFAVIFASQVIFIMYRDWRAAFFSALQCFFAVFLYEDFTFLPVIKPFFRIAVSFPYMTFSKIYFLQYLMVSILLSLEIFKTLVIYYSFKKK
ncbi:hypothetical protein Emin_1089 [Elusimicrobium minutum Pei191]|uniref:Uncharacterized protein n=1 Tax=Elusimicrobium minutum (strain Pei191) TaxID=445932 RepID=B2KDP5_ELUMP|nr:hypothetical protein [Elusimicrobium minutum]ACC98641.1 hypothetical protein Emin_1089 [Elusimicrobium minutum Pei191]